MSDDNLTWALETAGLRRSEFTVPLSFHEIPMPREPQRLNALRAVLEEDKAVQAIRVAGQEFIDLTGVVVAERADDYVKRRIAPREEQVGEYCIHHGNLAFVGNGTVGEKGHYYEGTYTPDNGVVRALEDAGLHRTGLGVAFSTGGHATNVTRASEEKIRSRVANARVSLARSC